MVRRHGNAPCWLDERGFYTLVRRFSGLPPKAVEDDCTTLLKWHGGWVLPPHFQGLESCALLVCHRRFCDWLSSSHERAQRLVIHIRRLLPNPSDPFQLHRLSALFHGRPPGFPDDLPQKNEHRCHARDERWLSAGVAPAGCFTADVSVFVAHLLGSLG